MFPPPKNPYFYFIAGGLEAVLAGALITYYRSWRAWTVLMLMLAVWAGFSFYTALFGLSCLCLGLSLELPRGMSLIINGLMMLGAWTVLSHYPSHPIKFKRIILFVVLFFIIGFVIGVIYYNNNLTI
jgi:hypothetical protein